MKIAVIGGGISGLASALILNPHHEVHLFEADSRLGGHAHTVTINDGPDKTVDLDTGFLVYNTLTYPHFTRFLDYLNVKSTDSDMTLSIQAANGLEWGGANLPTVFAQKINLFNPSFLKMLLEILRFNKNAQTNLELSRKNKWTLADLVKNQGYGEKFQTLYLLPMTGAIWSMSYSHALQFPAETFLTFCINHHLLQVNNRPIWRTIKGGSINYVKEVSKRLSNIHLSSPVDKVSKKGDKLIVSTQGKEFEFDKVILATHAPISRRMIEESFPDLAQRILPLKTTPNHVVLHEDESIMPKKKICWSAWNVEARNSVKDEKDICLTYYINKLQPLETTKNYFVTLNKNQKLLKAHRTFEYHHPQFDFEAINLQKELPSIQGTHHLYFAGAWTRYGFHEDGILSAVNVAEILGVKAPWV
ncbi:MAG: NAD(P)/FAD-dependent oxidoreductase [Bacteriovoracaceae bacterium]